MIKIYSRITEYKASKELEQFLSLVGYNTELYIKNLENFDETTRNNQDKVIIVKSSNILESIEQIQIQLIEIYKLYSKYKLYCCEDIVNSLEYLDQSEAISLGHRDVKIRDSETLNIVVKNLQNFEDSLENIGQNTDRVYLKSCKLQIQIQYRKILKHIKYRSTVWENLYTRIVSLDDITEQVQNLYKDLDKLQDKASRQSKLYETYGDIVKQSENGLDTINYYRNAVKLELTSRVLNKISVEYIETYNLREKAVKEIDRAQKINNTNIETKQISQRLLGSNNSQKVESAVETMTLYSKYIVKDIQKISYNQVSSVIKDILWNELDLVDILNIWQSLTDLCQIEYKKRGYIDPWINYLVDCADKYRQVLNRETSGFDYESIEEISYIYIILLETIIKLSKTSYIYEDIQNRAEKQLRKQHKLRKIEDR